MKHIVKYKLFESENWGNDTFQTIEEYITAFCDNINIENLGQETIDLRKMNSRTPKGTNGIMTYLFYKTNWPVMEIERADMMEIFIRTDITFKYKEEVQTNTQWLIDRIDKSDIKVNFGTAHTGDSYVGYTFSIKSVSGLKKPKDINLLRKIGADTSPIKIKFDIIKKIL